MYAKARSLFEPKFEQHSSVNQLYGLRLPTKKCPEKVRTLQLECLERINYGEEMTNPEKVGLEADHLLLSLPRSCLNYFFYHL